MIENLDTWALNVGTPTGILAYLLFKFAETQKAIANELGEIKGMLGVYVNGRSRSGKKDNPR